jgi:hypothetical protein
MKSKIFLLRGLLLLCTLVIAAFVASATTTSTPPTTYQTTIPTTVPPTTIPMTCQDTDGTDITVKGNTWGSMWGSPYNYTDSCIGTAYIREYYCSGISATSPDMLVLTCPQGYACSDGRCAYSTPTTISSTTSPTYQTSIPTTAPPTTYPTTHYPTTIPPTTYPTSIPTTPPTTYPTTSPTYQTSIPTTVPPTTVPVTCHDTDGTDITVKGTTSGSLGGMPYSYTDSCIGALYVKEWYCGGANAGFPEMIVLSCPPQHICSDGRCIYSTATTVPPSTFPTSMPTTTPITTVPPSTNPTSIPTTTPSTTPITTTTLACSFGPGYNSCTTSGGLAGVCRWGSCWALGACCYYSGSGQCEYTNGHDCIMYGLGRFVAGTACDASACSTATTTTSTVVTWPSSMVTTTTTSSTPGTTYMPYSCFDSDGTNYSSYYTKGSVEGLINSQTYEFTDYCTDNYVNEWTCVGGTPQLQMYVPCPYACVDGACVQNITITTTTTTPPITTPAECSDTDGLDASTKGNVEGWFGMSSDTFNNSDTCANSTTVREYFCRYNANFQESMRIDCPESAYCSDGRCTYITNATTTTTTSSPPTTFTTPNSCHLSGNWSLNISGYVWGIYEGKAYNYSDTCKNATAAIKGVCIASDYEVIPGNETINCPANNYCIEGACASSASDECHEVNVRNTSVKGYIWGTYLGRQFNYTDTCINNSAITERFCIYSADDRSQPYYETRTCEAGKHCLEGACAAETQNTCQDSDEQNTMEKGSTYGTLDGREYNYTDTCYSADHVQKFYCGGLNVTLPQMTTVACQENLTCKEGRCVSGNSSLRECNMPGNSYPCDQMVLSKVVSSITEWMDARINLGDVIRLIMSWADPETNTPN